MTTLGLVALLLAGCGLVAFAWVAVPMLSPRLRAVAANRRMLLVDVVSPFVPDAGRQPMTNATITGDSVQGPLLTVTAHPRPMGRADVLGWTISATGVTQLAFSVRRRSEVSDHEIVSEAVTGDPVFDGVFLVEGDLDHACARLSPACIAKIDRVSSMGELHVETHLVELRLSPMAWAPEVVSSIVREVLDLAVMLQREIALDKALMERMASGFGTPAATMALRRLLSIADGRVVDDHVDRLVSPGWTVEQAVSRLNSDDGLAAWWLGAHGGSEAVEPLLAVMAAAPHASPFGVVVRGAVARLRSRLPANAGGRLTIAASSELVGQLSTAKDPGMDGGLSVPGGES